MAHRRHTLVTGAIESDMAVFFWECASPNPVTVGVKLQSAAL
jgi:hypothetical protein